MRYSMRLKMQLQQKLRTFVTMTETNKSDFDEQMTQFNPLLFWLWPLSMTLISSGSVPSQFLWFCDVHFDSYQRTCHCGCGEAVWGCVEHEWKSLNSNGSGVMCLPSEGGKQAWSKTHLLFAAILLLPQDEELLLHGLEEIKTLMFILDILRVGSCNSEDAWPLKGDVACVQLRGDHRCGQSGCYLLVTGLHPSQNTQTCGGAAAGAGIPPVGWEGSERRHGQSLAKHQLPVVVDLHHLCTRVCRGRK